MAMPKSCCDCRFYGDHCCWFPLPAWAEATISAMPISRADFCGNDAIAKDCKFYEYYVEDEED